MPNKELKKLLDYCLNVKECSKCDYAKEEDCMLTCSALIKECLNENYAEVVRCKDCRYWQDNNGGYPHEECRWWKDETPDEYDFCSYGERKEE